MHINNLLNIDMVCCVVLCRVGLCVADWHVLGDFECGLWSSQTGECMFISLFSPTFGFQFFFIVQIFPHLLSPLRRLFHSSIRFCPVWRLIWIRVRCEVFPDKWNVFWTSFFLSISVLSLLFYLLFRRKLRKERMKAEREKFKPNAIGRKYA